MVGCGVDGVARVAAHAGRFRRESAGGGGGGGQYEVGPGGSGEAGTFGESGEHDNRRGPGVGERCVGGAVGGAGVEELESGNGRRRGRGRGGAGVQGAGLCKAASGRVRREGEPVQAVFGEHHGDRMHVRVRVRVSSESSEPYPVLVGGAGDRVPLSGGRGRAPVGAVSL